MLQEQVEKLAATNSRDYVDNVALFIELKDLYMTLFGRSLCCLPEVESALIALRNYLTKTQNQNTMTNENLFQLKPESLLYSVASDTYYTEKTITDEDAKELLKASPSLINQFEIYPDNWQELCGVTDANAAPSAVEGYDAEKMSVKKTTKSK